MRLNPLHNVEMLTSWIANTGEYPDSTRCTGRSTSQALRGLAWCIRNPYKTLRVVDHHNTVTAHRLLRKTMQEMVEKLGLKHFYFTDDCVRFGNVVPPALTERPYTLSLDDNAAHPLHRP